MAENTITYEIVEELGVISEGKKGWQKELNKVSWNDGAAKYDIRDWSSDHTKMSKGITLTADELKSLASLLAEEVKKL